VTANASTPREIDAAFASLIGQQVSALLVGGDALFFTQRDQLVALAVRHSVPTIYGWREGVDAGGLISYGASLSDTYRLAGTYVGRILKGEKPDGLPVQQITTIELVARIT
jgi:putative ABC transport system substrate-binding protein